MPSRKWRWPMRAWRATPKASRSRRLSSFPESCSMLSSKRLAIPLLLCAALLLASCGFQLRGSYELPYKSVFVAAAGTSQVAASLRRELINNNTLIAAAETAEARIVISEERRDKQILSLSGAGRVKEYT